jgi:uncharacterized protein YfiM (DUF2279 family)
MSFGTSTAAQAQTDSLSQLTAKQWINYSLLTAGVYSVSLLTLDQLWYARQARTDFHFFDDAAEWKQVDKAGHAYTAFHLSRGAHSFFRKKGLSPRKSSIYAAMAGFLFISPIEIPDGFSAAYGASWSDLAANLTGSVFFASQQLIWQEIRIQAKYSFHFTDFAARRPNVLGKTWAEQLLKDYNGHTYWLSVDLDKFVKKKKIPAWLNLAVGYGASNMIYAEDAQNLGIGLQPYRRFFLGLDLDLQSIRTRKKWLRSLLNGLGMLRIPAPTLEWNTQGKWVWHWIY